MASTRINKLPPGERSRERERERERIAVCSFPCQIAARFILGERFVLASWKQGKKKEGDPNHNPAVEVVQMDVERAVEVEDDLFFADLTKRISLLITEDDEEDFPAHYPPLSPQDRHQTSQPFITSHPLLYEASNGRETNKGTGVFIPRSSLPRRKHRSGRSKQSDKTRAASRRLTSSTTNSNP